MSAANIAKTMSKGRMNNGVFMVQKDSKEKKNYPLLSHMLHQAILWSSENPSRVNWNWRETADINGIGFHARYERERAIGSESSITSGPRVGCFSYSLILGARQYVEIYVPPHVPRMLRRKSHGATYFRCC